MSLSLRRPVVVLLMICTMWMVSGERCGDHYYSAHAATVAKDCHLPKVCISPIERPDVHYIWFKGRHIPKFWISRAA
jgi:hypothetical protein